jgi:S-formylglutathione hydrolase FrmB
VASLEPFTSDVLKGNPLGDPSERTIATYVPKGRSGEGLPLLVFLPGFTGGGPGVIQNEPFLGESLFRLFDRLVLSGACRPAHLVAPDCRTCLGGSQYVNSTATGPYEDYVIKEVIPWAREKFHSEHLGILGQSSGGFGALHLAMSHPRLFEAVGSSAGDMSFPLLFMGDFPKAARHMRGFGGPDSFIRKVLEDRSTELGPFDLNGASLLVLAMAACYSPRANEPGAFDLPFDLETGALLPEVWQRWLAFDPLERLDRPEVQEGLRALRSLHLTASTSDEFYLDLAARQFARKARALKIPIRHEESPGGHFLQGERFSSLFKEMVRALTA